MRSKRSKLLIFQRLLSGYSLLGFLKGPSFVFITASNLMTGLVVMQMAGLGGFRPFRE